MKTRVWVVVAAVFLVAGARAQTRKRPAAHKAAAATHASGHAGLRTGARTKAGKRAAAVTSRKGKGRVTVHRAEQVPVTAESRRLTTAFAASAQLRPMAQQLVMSRSAAAYSGVAAYAAGHPGDAGAAANLAMGHAYLLDHRYGEAQEALRRAVGGSGGSGGTGALADYAEYLGAQAALQGGRPQDAIALLKGFGERHPGSLFVPTAPVMLANAYVAAGNPGEGLRVLQAQAASQQARHVDFRMAMAAANQAAGDRNHAAELYRGVYLKDPQSPEAVTAKKQLDVLGIPLTSGERKQHADALFNAKQYAQAETEYRAIQHDGTGLGAGDRDALEIYAAVCDLRLKRLSESDVARLPVTSDDTAALKLYMQSELARTAGRTDQHDALVAQLSAKSPQSRWLEEALYSGGNMYLVKRDVPRAIAEYSALVEHFPRSTYAPSAHWHTAWLTYRLRRYGDAARLMSEQIQNYPGGTEIPGALYWRARMYEDQDHNFSQALNFYAALDATYVNTYYAMLGRQRIAVIGSPPAAAPDAVLTAVAAVEDPHLVAALPENDPHLIKARLLANAALNEYIRPEIQLSATSGQWGALAEAQIYQSFGENTRAIQAMKRSKIPLLSLPVKEVPREYWELAFPRPYFAQIAASAQANGLDPYLVTSLIRQESEFNAGAVSKANAYGLMQLLPSVGKSLAKQQGDRHFSTNDLLDPNVNVKLGTADLRKTIDRWNGQVEYALAAYNAGDTPVHAWIAMGDYKDVAEWVESIPYTETREYVQAILRNREVYRAVYAGGGSRAASSASTGSIATDVAAR